MNPLSLYLDFLPLELNANIILYLDSSEIESLCFNNKLCESQSLWKDIFVLRFGRAILNDQRSFKLAANHRFAIPDWLPNTDYKRFYVDILRYIEHVERRKWDNLITIKDIFSLLLNLNSYSIRYLLENKIMEFSDAYMLFMYKGIDYTHQANVDMLVAFAENYDFDEYKGLKYPFIDKHGILKLNGGVSKLSLKIFRVILSEASLTGKYSNLINKMLSLKVISGHPVIPSIQIFAIITSLVKENINVGFDNQILNILEEYINRRSIPQIGNLKYYNGNIREFINFLKQKYNK